MSSYYYWADLSEVVRHGIIANKRNGVPFERPACGCRVESGVEGWFLCPYHRDMQEKVA